MRRISFALTTTQVQNQTKTVTRRIGWDNLKPGDRLQPIAKGMGLKKGEKQQLLNGPIEIVSFRKEPIAAVTQADVIAEGFPSWTPETFVTFLCKKHLVSPDTIVNRIEFKYLEEQMELKSSGTFSMASGRPIDTVRFTKVSYSHLEYDREEPGELSEHVTARIEFPEAVRSEFNAAMNNLIPIVVDALDLGKTWLQGEIYCIKTQWTWSGDKWLLKINEIELRRSTFNGEIPMQRSVKTGKITEEGFDIFTRSMLENIWDEAWIHLKRQPKQGDLFEPLADWNKEEPGHLDTGDLDSKPIDLAALKKDLTAMGVENYRIEDYLGECGDTHPPSVEGFHEWQCEPDQQESIAPVTVSKRTRSKAKKEPVPA